MFFRAEVDTNKTSVVCIYYPVVVYSFRIPNLNTLQYSNGLQFVTFIQFDVKQILTAFLIKNQFVILINFPIREATYDVELSFGFRIALYFYLAEATEVSPSISTLRIEADSHQLACEVVANNKVVCVIRIPSCNSVVLNLYDLHFLAGYTGPEHYIFAFNFLILNKHHACFRSPVVHGTYQIEAVFKFLGFYTTNFLSGNPNLRDELLCSSIIEIELEVINLHILQRYSYIGCNQFVTEFGIFRQQRQSKTVHVDIHLLEIATVSRFGQADGEVERVFIVLIRSIEERLTNELHIVLSSFLIHCKVQTGNSISAINLLRTDGYTI